MTPTHDGIIEAKVVYIQLSFERYKVKLISPPPPLVATYPFADKCVLIFYFIFLNIVLELFLIFYLIYVNNVLVYIKRLIQGIPVISYAQGST